MPTGPAPRSLADIAAQSEAAARAVPGVTALTVTVGRRPAPRPRPLPARAGAPDRAASDEATGRPPAHLDGGPWQNPPTAPATLVDALTRAAGSGHGTTFVLGDGNEDRQSYRRLLADAARVLTGLRESGLAVGDSVLLHCDDNRNFVTGFWACVLGGFVPTPIGVAPTYRWDTAVTRRLRGAWELLDRAPVLTDAALAGQVAGLRTLWDTTALRILAVEDLRTAEPGEPRRVRPDDPAVHLLTSGSTGVPKCVRHTHRTVVTRAYVNVAANGFGPEEVTLNFMPLDHVAGMVMHNVRDVVMEWDHVNARTDSFIADPLRWLDWIERYRVTNSSAPNFVITLMTNLAAEISRRTWDLSSLRDITNGGEAVVGHTTQEFLRMLAPHGLAEEVMRPAWGMSEVCGGMVHSTLRADREPTGVLTVDAGTLGGTVVPLDGPAPGHPTYAEVGVPAPGTSLRIVDDAGQVVPEDRIGHLQVRGVTRMVGYHNNPEANRESFTADDWFVTGDLAFVHRGRLVITGREKEVVVVRSANYSCHEIESVVERVDGVLPTFVAACSEYDPDTGADELVVLCVLTGGTARERGEAVSRIRARLAKEVGLLPRTVVPVPRAEFPKSSAGKIERKRLLAEYQAGAFDDALADLPAAPQDHGDDEPASWLHRTTWAPAASAPGRELPGGVWLVFGAVGLAARLRAVRPDGGPVVPVASGAAFALDDSGTYRIDPLDPAHCAALLAAVRREHGTVGAVVHALGADLRTDPGGHGPSAGSLHSLIKALGAERPVLHVVTAGALATPDDPVEPAGATVTGLVRTANAEAGEPWVRQLDLSPGDPDPAASVLAELGVRGTDDVVARRDGRRLVPRLAPLHDVPPDTAHRIRPGGLYLLTGGLGGIGVRLARFLIAEHGVRLVLTGRSAPTGDRAASLAELTALGEVVYSQADVTDLVAMRAAVTGAEERFGQRLDGLVHLAGAGFGHYWQDLGSHLLTTEDPVEFQRMSHAKVTGTSVIAEVLRDRPDALLILFSSVNGHFGGTGFGAYSSASGYLPAFAAYWRRLGRPVQCQSWSRWTTEEDGDAGLEALRRRGYREIDPRLGVRLFRTALAHPDEHVLVGLDDRNEYIARELDPALLGPLQVTVAYRGEAPDDRVRRAVVSAVGPDVAVRVEPSADTVGDAGREPVGEAERAVAEIWRAALRLATLDRADHFFDRGGNSLAAMRLVDRLNVAFDVQLTVQHLYDHPTVEELAREVERLREPVGGGAGTGHGREITEDKTTTCQ
ncbi:SDR family NAD(P)-dependent oxidoreductase [Streptomyces olivaceus]|uniref:SDR family NAD(P)-dependent oxidoreductase n=1 Tax=Streptomyces olivaceus TaxID=47716 RepID=UPI001CCA1A3A|nr:SDR family NAD(P)-dependent oxidoreductase [Streptomyces olivaceus]MBZ6085407.1 SDR family NAD(P)-dependent oxidoreductase [Streptomyces olivaceus]